MTCVIGLVERGTVYIGGDTAGTDDWYGQCEFPADEKVFNVGKFLIGICGSPRVGQLIRFKFTPPIYDADTDPFDYMVSSFTEELRKVVHETGSGWKEDNMEWMETQFMVGWEGKLYIIEENFQIIRPKKPYMAMGAGKDIALGAMFVTNGTSPEDRIKSALKASATFNCTVRAPFVVRST